MNFLSSVTDEELVLVIDTSVLISLYACTYGEQILSAIPNKIIVPQIVVSEFERGTQDKNFLPTLANKKIVELSELTDEEDELFEKFILTLDDGESATIAIAINRNILPVIDERKGRGFLIGLNANIVAGWSLDLIRHSKVISKLGSPDDLEALFLALYESHMRIPEERAEEIIALIGEDRARKCTCLPGYKRRFPQ